MKKNLKKQHHIISVIKNILLMIYGFEIIVILLVNTEASSAHQECNLKLKVDPDKIKIPVIFHNLRGYDSHFIMQEIGAIVKNHTYKNKKGEEKQMIINHRKKIHFPMLECSWFITVLLLVDYWYIQVIFQHW